MAFFEVLTTPNVLEDFVVVVEGSFVDDGFLAVSLERARVFLSAVARFLC